MSVRKYNPTTNARRISSVDAFDDVTKFEPEKKLTIARKQQAGRSNGKIAVRHRGGGAKRRIRVVDFRRDKYDVPAKIVAIEYDPGRGARLALLHYADGEKRYMVASLGLKVGATVISSKEKGEIADGNRYRLEFIPVGMNVHDVEIVAGKGGQLVRGAGVGAQIMAVEGSFATLKLPSGELRQVSKECMATIGQVSNPDRRLIRWGKAGRTRLRGIRPTVRGKAMNPVDHPHGGGEGRNSIGLKNPKTPQGKPALGVKTRRKKASDKLIIQRRPKGRFVGA
ncbi:50S ribosomal protein L2 [Candidatus Uhrbacteria bacterium RIFOXYB12_FULL_58_10]|uniref:Large ribosomal subunit protein uL2 n=1 Tax=Candidatus Uhrbacteria bacterium RIFOXYB2_FULL_57_15 TaxID=1802422 RepID=A0A1F7W8B7_9BACT|nr:MAG: 50S ribosomal protein L2 [Candidatus Uhrbacteria bacterium RIFOXYB12_FULL_58_10]OGL99032.1 MAG: 50S ribosomal protein L2 [Candidatus Uhrbacteria bacterium RIFOXYB2_FULL_57_15]OGM00252.1 MAG: 50S ribosomal protein L2 [Candidatus Uhrbacteria bacterium RIFOXYC12_FULL_57_11]